MSTSDTTTPVPTNRDPRTDTPHLQHVREHLARLRDGVSSVVRPEEVFLGQEETDHFWEVVGLRLRGHPTVVLAAIRFQRHEYPGTPWARESLAAYLTAPPAPMASAASAARAGEISAYLPRWHESVPGFLARLRSGPDQSPVHLSRDVVEVAFDLRMANPSGMEVVKRKAGPMESYLFRTTGGHVLRGNSHGTGRNPGHDSRFVALTSCEQLTPKGRNQLPAVMLNRDFIAVAVSLADEKTRLAAPNWTPFLPVTASKRHLLV